MNTDDLRQALSEEAQQQPTVSPDLPAGIDRRVRRQRLQAATVVAPILILVLLAGAVLLPRSARETTLATASGGPVTTAVPTTAQAPTTTATPATTAAPTTTSAPATTEAPTAAAPAPTAPTVPAPDGNCGTITVSALTAGGFDKTGFDCFLKAFNAGVAADLTVVVNSPDGGSITDHIASTPGHLVTVSVDGSMTMKLPAFSFGGGGGSIGGAGGAGGDCGTVTVASGGFAPGAATSSPDAKAMQCLMKAFMSGGSASITFVINGPQGGAITTAIDLGADKVLTITLSGSMTVQAPATLTIPEDLMNAIPPNGMGLGGIPGMPGMPGTGPWGHK